MRSPTTRHHVQRAYFALGLAVLLWAGAFPATRFALLSLSPEHLMAARFTLASMVLLAWAMRCKVRFPARKDLGRLLLIGVASGFAYQMAFNHGMRSVSSGPAAAIVDTAPIFAAILGALLLRERLGWVGWTGMATGLAGVAMIAVGERGELVLEPGALLLLLAALLFASNVVMQKPLHARYRVVEISVWLLVSGTLPMLIFLPGAIAPMLAAPREAILAVIFLALFPAALGFVLWNHALAHLPVAQVSSSLYLLPPVAFLIAWVWLAEIPGVLSIAGAVLALAGVALVQYPLLAARRNGRAGAARAVNASLVQAENRAH
jgi:drug/metabolite transporter (DMT)-like permease